MVRVFDRIVTEPLASLDELENAGELFPPVFVGLRTRRWRRAGRLPLPPFDFPRFRSYCGSGPGTFENWWLWDGKDRKFIGVLPPQLRSLEVEVVWGDEALEERIATGVNPFAEVK
jgi:hypothetical protein